MQIENGRYPATAIKAVVYESEAGSLVVATSFRLENNIDIIGRTTLINKDGAINTKSLEKLKACYGWDGLDPFWLTENSEGKTVELTIENEEYEGKVYPKVKYVDPPGGGGAPLPQSADRKSVLAKYGAQFRALAGGTPAKPAAPPKPPTPPPPPAPAPTPEPPKRIFPPSNMEACWARLNVLLEGKTEDDITKAWYSTIELLFPGRNNTQLTPSDWGQLLSEINQRFDAMPG